MPTYRAVVPSTQSAEETFTYMAAFDNVAEWDPGVKRAERLGDGGDVGLGSRFKVVLSTAGRETPLEYSISEFKPPTEVVLKAQSATLRSTDRIRVDPTGEGAKVTYDAEVVLLGLLRFLNPVFGPVFKRAGDRAADGLRRRLSR